ncbi:phosphoribosyltransferase [Pseudomonas paralcaligenes]|uniref:phosphoribosyltransferase n=1 Tax=Pseudomonas paralcaligenes TaxID=2772558 RepID=UPI001C7E4058|nr:phosphoribosyltransferase [Pseudomonas paralcaligenes]
MGSLPHQEVRVYAEIDYNDIMYLYDYHPWYKNDVKNPKIDQVTHDILNIKNTDPRKLAYRQKAVSFFSRALTSQKPPGLSTLLDKTTRSAFAVVPSSTAWRVSVGLMELINSIQGEFRFSNEGNPLARHITVPKAATGGLREQRIHLDSIRSSGDVAGKEIFLFDDVTTTGCSLLACRRILLEAGASRVAMIALGKTCQDG